MTTPSPKDNLAFQEAFGIILSIDSLSDYVIDIAELIYNKNLDRKNIQEILEEHKIKKIEDIKEELLDLLIVYINLVLNDHLISSNEKYNVEVLKKYFKIEEGDFYKYRYQEVEDVLQRQFEKIYLDNVISKEEALHSVELQGLFDLSYDQFDKFKENEISKALGRGANIMDLDTVRSPELIMAANKLQNRHISQQVKDSVWNRDKGKCRECGSEELLGLDYIIPFGKGGAHTYRNIQLLCESCSRARFDEIG